MLELYVAVKASGNCWWTPFSAFSERGADPWKSFQQVINTLC